MKVGDRVRTRTAEHDWAFDMMTGTVVEVGAPDALDTNEVQVHLDEDPGIDVMGLGVPDNLFWFDITELEVIA